MGGAAPAVETTGIPRAVMMDYYRKAAAAESGIPYGGSLVGGSLVGGARDSSMKEAFFRDQILNKGRHPSVAQRLWDEMGKLSTKIPIQTVVSAPGRAVDFGNMQPIADEIMNQSANSKILELIRRAQRDPFPDNTAANAAYGGSLVGGAYDPRFGGMYTDLQGGDIFGDILQGLSWLSPIGAAANVASMIAGGKAPKKKKAAAKKKAAPKKAAAKKGKSKKDLSGDGFLDDIGQAFSFLTPWGLAGQAAGALVGATS
jgi:hypothetical protein